MLLLQAVECVKKHPVWYSVVCTSAITDDSQDSIMCDSCLIGHHFMCTSLRQRPKSRVWFCHVCRTVYHAAWPLSIDGLFTVTLVDITCTSMKGTARPITLSPQKRRGIQPNVHVVAQHMNTYTHSRVFIYSYT